MMSHTKKKLAVALVGVFSMFAAGYCFLGQMMVASFSATPGYSPERAKSGMALYTGGMLFFTVLLVVCFIVLSKLSKQESASNKLQEAQTE